VAKLLPEAKQRYRTTVTGIDADTKTVTLSDGRQVKYEALLSTLPLDVTCRWLKRPEWADGLQHSSSHIVGFGIRGKCPHGAKCWLYFPEDNCPFYRCARACARPPCAHLQRCAPAHAVGVALRARDGSRLLCLRCGCQYDFASNLSPDASTSAISSAPLQGDDLLKLRCRKLPPGLCLAADAVPRRRRRRRRLAPDAWTLLVAHV
jgi:hypothetical protein